jgi:hypothetical protein
MSHKSTIIHDLANGLSRRDWLRAAACGVGGLAAGNWAPAFAETLAQSEKRRHVVLLWMSGGASQLDTFDMKPEHANGGEFKSIDTNVPGLQISEHLPKLAKMAQHLAIVRSLSTTEGDHGRGTYLMRTGHRPGGPIQYPTLGSLISKQLGSNDAELPNFVSVSPYRVFNRPAFQPGFLGPRYAALTVGAADSFQRQTQPQDGYAELGVDDLQAPADINSAQVEGRFDLLQALQDDFARRLPSRIRPFTNARFV